MGSSRRRSDASPAPKRPAGATIERAAAALGTLLPSQRWFGAKSRTMQRVALVDHAPVPPTKGALALFRVEFTEGAAELYGIPLLPRAGEPTDALDDPAFCVALVEHIRRGSTLSGRHGAFTFTPAGPLDEILPAPPSDAVRISSEQSHTSVVLGGRAILKSLRRLEPGPSPELEITAFLTARTPFRGAPRLAGSIAYEAPGDEPIALALLHEFVPNQGDAWSAAQRQLDEYYATVGNGDRPAPDPVFARTLAAADAKEARSLGALTGQLHMALASAPAGSPLGPERISPAEVRTWQEQMQAQLDRALAALGAAVHALPADTRSLAQGVLGDTARLRDGLAELRALGDEPVAKIRIHGDYHLGQVLRTPDGFAILDFEGEPARPLAQRRAKQCALKDVAGMLRSYAYAAQAALRRALEANPHDSGLADRLAPWAAAWEAGVRSAFLEGYLAETAQRDAAFLPAPRAILDAVLRVFELDKALYELAYELDHRPHWTRIPLEGLQRALAMLPRLEVIGPRPDVGPFRFVGCIELPEFVGARAEDERQLAELIDQVPVDSIYFHTHAFFLRHKFVAGLYPNDFASWAAVHVRDQVLGERLAMVDPMEFSDLEALRQEFVTVIDEHLRRLGIVPRVVSAEPFDFVSARLVPIPLAVHAQTLPELRQTLLEVDVSAIYFHLVEARRRLGQRDNDIARWLERGLGMPALADRVRGLNPYTASLERTRARLIQLCDAALAEGGRR